MSTPEPEPQTPAEKMAEKVAEEKLAGERLKEVYRQAKEALAITEADYRNGQHQPIRVREMDLAPGTYEIDFHRVGSAPRTFTYVSDPDEPIVLPPLKDLPVR